MQELSTQVSSPKQKRSIVEQAPYVAKNKNIHIAASLSSDKIFNLMIEKGWDENESPSKHIAINAPVYDVQYSLFIDPTEEKGSTK